MTDMASTLQSVELRAMGEQLQPREGCEYTMKKDQRILRAQGG